MAAYVKSVLWLAGCGAMGYGLFLAALGSSSNQDLSNSYKQQAEETGKRNAMSVLSMAADSSKPLYSMNKAEIDKELSKRT